MYIFDNRPGWDLSPDQAWWKDALLTYFLDNLFSSQNVSGGATFNIVLDSKVQGRI